VERAGDRMVQVFAVATHHEPATQSDLHWPTWGGRLPCGFCNLENRAWKADSLHPGQIRLRRRTDWSSFALIEHNNVPDDDTAASGYLSEENHVVAIADPFQSKWIHKLTG